MHTAPSSGRLSGPVRHACAWRAGDLTVDSWVTLLTQGDHRELDRALKHAMQRLPDWRDLTRENFPLDALGEKLQSVEQELRDGRGFVVLRGLPVRSYKVPEHFYAWMGISSWLGTVISQNAQGELIAPVTDGGMVHADAQGQLVPSAASPPGANKDPNFRLYKSRAELRIHNDSADLVGLLCVQTSKTGGQSSIASSMAIYNEILQRAPELLQPLYEGYHYDVRGEGVSGKLNEVTKHKVPVYSYFKGRLSCRFNPKTIESAQAKIGVALSTDQLAAVRMIEELADTDTFRLDMQLQPGDMQILNNLVTLHSRSEFEDWDEPDRKRLLLRSWINLRNGPELAPEFSNRYNAGERSGIPVLQPSPAPPMVS